MLVFLTLALFGGVVVAAILLVTKGANTWKTVAEGVLLEVRAIECVVPDPPYLYSEDRYSLPQAETTFRFADGSEYRVPGLFPGPHPTGRVRLLKNWIGLYRLEEIPS